MANEINDESSEKPHVLTKDEAVRILIAAFDYLTLANDHIAGNHRTEVVAKAAEQNQEFELASDLLAIHNVLKEFGNGNLRAIKYLGEAPVGDNLLETAKNSTLINEAKSLASSIEPIEEILEGQSIDWEKSFKVLAEVKKEKFPEKLTMVEKLSNWQRGKSSAERS